MHDLTAFCQTALLVAAVAIVYMALLMHEKNRAVSSLEEAVSVRDEKIRHLQEKVAAFELGRKAAKVEAKAMVAGIEVSEY